MSLHYSTKYHIVKTYMILYPNIVIVCWLHYALNQNDYHRNILFYTPIVYSILYGVEYHTTDR